MKIIRDIENEKLFKKRIFEHPKIDRGKEIHVSDLVYCMRKAYFRLTNTQPTDTATVEYAVIGKTLHKIIQDVFLYTEVEVENYGVKGTIDVLESHTLGKIPIEIKTTRKNIKDASDIPEIYLTQLAYYCCLLNVHSGYLAILNIVDADLRLFIVTFENLESIKAEMLGKKALLLFALEQKNFHVLPKLVWMCNSCEFRGLCNGNGKM